MQIDEMLMKALTTYDNNRERSQQKQIGVSQIGGCRKQVWLQIQNTPKTNETLKLPALMGTAIHKMIEEALVKDNAANWGEYWLEEEVEYDGLKGHIDLYIPSVGAVVDWKTTKLKNLTYFPNTQQRTQVQLYAYLLSKNGHSPKTVTLVAIPRDGDERNIKLHTEEYNEAIALEGLKWLREVQNMDIAPAPEKYAAQFCKFYCSYYGESCGGKGKEVATETISDDQIISVAETYMQCVSDINKLEKVKEELKSALENVNGVTPSGITISWSQIAGRQSIDEKAVEEALGFVPKKQGEATMRLTVK
jgi:hypothetical protein